MRDKQLIQEIKQTFRFGGMEISVVQDLFQGRDNTILYTLYDGNGNEYTKSDASRFVMEKFKESDLHNEVLKFNSGFLKQGKL